MTNKSLLQIILIILLLLLLVGCNASSNSSPMPEPAETEEPATVTPAPDETEEPASTPEVVDVSNPLPNNNGEFYVAPSSAEIANNLNVGEAPGGYNWIVVTVSLGNDEGETIVVNAEDISLIGSNGSRYPTYEMVERVSPQLVNSELSSGESVYGFALFALPPNVEPSLFEWCPAGTCETPLQAPISLQNQSGN